MTSIEAGDMESLRLESYLDLLPLSAMILTLEGETVTPDTLKVSYVNKVFLEIVEDSHWTEEERFNSVPPDPITGIGGNFVLLLQEQFVTPSSTRFLEWIEKVMNAPNSIHYLKTRVQGFTPTKIDATDRSPHFVDIEWNAVIMQKKFIVLTGRTTGTVQFSTTPTTKESEHLGYGIMSPPIEEEELEGPILSSANAPATASSTSSSDSIKSRRKPNRAVSSTTQSTSERTRRSSFADDTVVPTASSGDTWRNNEKVYLW
jgi:hypothetical protein